MHSVPSRYRPVSQSLRQFSQFVSAVVGITIATTLVAALVGSILASVLVGAFSYFNEWKCCHQRTAYQVKHIGHLQGRMIWAGSHAFEDGAVEWRLVMLHAHAPAVWTLHSSQHTLYRLVM